MAVTFTLKVTALRVTKQDDLQDVIKEVEVMVRGEEGAASFELPARVKFGPADPENFSPFAELDEPTVLSWLDEHPDLEGPKAHVAYVVAREVERLGLTDKPAPWAPPAPEPTPTVPETPPLPADAP